MTSCGCGGKCPHEAAELLAAGFSATKMKDLPENREDLVRVWLTPVGVFGNVCEEECCRQPDGDNLEIPLGLMDQAGGLSDCNRAWGHIFRREEDDCPQYTNMPNFHIEAWVPRSDLWKFDRNWDEW